MEKCCKLSTVFQLLEFFMYPYIFDNLYFAVICCSMYKLIICYFTKYCKFFSMLKIMLL